MPQLAFFIGKGGVGKTTVSSAFAIHTAARSPHKKVLLISTDPAHSLADILQTHLGNSPRRILLRKGNLFAWQINAEKQFNKFLSKYREAIFTLIESGTIFSRQEIEPLLSSTLPGMAEVAALLGIFDVLASEKYDHIVVDTAPVGHTLRLFEMPEHFQRFLDFLDVAGSRDAVLAATFGGTAKINRTFVAEWRSIVEAVQKALRSGNSRLFLVTTPETFALNESVRAAQALTEGPSQLRISDIVLNRSVTTAQHNCTFCSQRARAFSSARRFLRKHFSGLSILPAEDSVVPLLDPAALAEFGKHVFAGKKLQLALTPLNHWPEPVFEKAKWPLLDTPITFTVGKGGVGKTTISSGLAFHQRAAERRIAVTICSTDPAPSLDDIFEQKVGDRAAPVLQDKSLFAAELDSVAEFLRWTDSMKERIDRAFRSEQRGVHLDLSFDRRLFSALLDVVPPGVDEIFAIFRILDLLEAGKRTHHKVIIDMAPTGHALELLRMPDRMLQWTRLLLKSLAAHRSLPLAQDVAVDVAELSQKFRCLSAILRDRKRSRVIPIMLAELLPDRETGRLLQALEAMQVPVSPPFVNRMLFPADIAGCGRCQKTRKWQLGILSSLQKERGRTASIYVVPNFPREIAGRKGLQSLTQQLWQLGAPKRARKSRALQR